MSQPFVGEIRMFGGNFAPAGWMFCAGQTLPISENETLFNLIGTTYGGDGQETFGLPDLQGRVPVHAGGPQNYIIGEKGGVESVTLTTNQIPSHNHTPNVVSGSGGSASTPTNQTILADCQVATTNTYIPFAAANAQIQMNNNSITVVGGSQPHDNIQETLAVSYIISLFGIYPQPN
jgi:microcystin-dependent protein